VPARIPDSHSPGEPPNATGAVQYNAQRPRTPAPAVPIPGEPPTLLATLAAHARHMSRPVHTSPSPNVLASHSEHTQQITVVADQIHVHSWHSHYDFCRDHIHVHSWSAFRYAAVEVHHIVRDVEKIWSVAPESTNVNMNSETYLGPSPSPMPRVRAHMFIDLLDELRSDAVLSTDSSILASHALLHALPLPL
jgi:hypothetical protein